MLSSPGIETREIDAGGGIQSLGSSPGAAVLDATWGPIDQRVLITNELELVNRFGKPTNQNARRWYTIKNFLSYVGSIFVVRTAGDGTLNANDTGTGILVKNNDDFENVDKTSYKFISRFAGVKGNSIKVEVCDSGDNFATWNFRSLFDSAPGTSDSADKFGSSNDELHLVVIDEKGKITGTPGSILETFDFLSKASDGKNETGGSTYYVNVINEQSNFIFAGTNALSEIDSEEEEEEAQSNYGDSVEDGSSFATGTDIITLQLTGGVDVAPTVGDATTSLQLFQSVEDINIDVILTADGFAPLADISPTFVNAAISIAESRKDCIVTASPMILSSTGGVVQDPAETTDTFFSSVTRSSYLFATSNYKYQYDKYNDLLRYIPDNGDIGGLISRLDRDFEPWFSPAGFNRGNIQNLTKLAWNPNQVERDNLYRNSINPVVTFPGSGTILFGDKTFVSKPGAFDRINVRRLFIVVRKNVSNFARSILFEVNDSFTRGNFTSAVEQFLETVQAARGIDEFEVVADSTNNTAAVLNANQFVGDIFIRPLNSINFVRLNFIAVPAGIEFSEITG
jgi:hypothetical protein